MQQAKGQAIDIGLVHQIKQNQQAKDSQFLQQYLLFFNSKTIDSHQLQEEQITTSRNQFKIETQSSFTSQLKIKIIRHSDNYQFLDISVSYGDFFIPQISIVNIKTLCPLKKQDGYLAGSSGTIYRTKYKSGYLASKIIYFQDDNPKRQVILNAINEYVCLVIANFLGAGPQFQKCYGFDLVIYQDAVLFSCQYCITDFDELYNQNLQKLEEDLKGNLQTMHSFHLIHMDIKPDNICFSRMMNKFVFIDYGFTKIIKQNVGKKTLTNFQGTLQYAGAQLQNLFKSKQVTTMIDLYYNDVQSLKKSLVAIRQKQSECFQGLMNDQMGFGQIYKNTNLNYQDITKQLYLHEIKYWIYKINYEKLKGIFIEQDFKKYVHWIQFQKILKFITMIKSTGLIQVIKPLFKDFYIDFDQDYNFNNINQYDQAEVQQDNQQFWNLLEIHEKQQQQQIVLTEDYIMAHTQIIKKIFKPAQYFLLLSANIQINISKYTFEKRSQFAKTAVKYVQQMRNNEQHKDLFNQIYQNKQQSLKSQSIQSKQAQSTKNAKGQIKKQIEKKNQQYFKQITKILLNYIMIEDLNKQTYEIFINILHNIIFMKILNVQQLFNMYQAIQYSRIQHISKLKLLFHFKTLLYFRMFETKTKIQDILYIFTTIYEFDIHYFDKLLENNVLSHLDKCIYEIFMSKLFNVFNQVGPYKLLQDLKQKILILLRQADKQNMQLLVDLKIFVFCHEMYYFHEHLHTQNLDQLFDYASMKALQNRRRFQYYHLFIIKFYLDKSHYKKSALLVKWWESICKIPQLFKEFSFQLIKKMYSLSLQTRYVNFGQADLTILMLLQNQGFQNQFGFLSVYVRHQFNKHLNYLYNFLKNMKQRLIDNPYIFYQLQFQQNFDIRLIKTQLTFNYQYLQCHLLLQKVYANQCGKVQVDNRYNLLVQLYKNERQFVLEIKDKNLKQQCLKLLLLHLQLLLNFKEEKLKTTYIFHQFNRFEYRLHQLYRNNIFQLPHYFRNFQLYHFKSLLNQDYRTILPYYIANKSQPYNFVLSIMKNYRYLKALFNFFINYPQQFIQFLENIFENISNQFSVKPSLYNHFFMILVKNIISQEIIIKNYSNLVTNVYCKINNPYLILYLIHAMSFQCTYYDQRLAVVLLKLMNRVDYSTIKLIQPYYYRIIYQRKKETMCIREEKRLFLTIFKSFHYFDYPIEFFRKKTIKIKINSQFARRSQKIQQIKGIFSNKVTNYYSNIGYNDQKKIIIEQNRQKYKDPKINYHMED